VQFGERLLKDHWHFVCPNAVAFDSVTIYSGGFEGVLVVYRTSLNRHAYLPRLGLTIEALALAPNSAFIAAITDRNILALVDCALPSLRASVCHPFGDHIFHNGQIISVRRPNLVQFFDSRTGNITEQLQTSSFNATVPITAIDFRPGLLVTVETSDLQPADELTMAQQSNLVHVRPHASSFLPRPRPQPPRAGVNTLLHDCDSAVFYCELKIWGSLDNKGFEVEQSVRVAGRPIHCVAIHPQLAVVAVGVGHDLQIWRRAGRWRLWRCLIAREDLYGLAWSPDGSVLLARFARRVAFCDLERFVREVEFDDVVNASFMSDYEVLVRTRTALTVFDLRSLSPVRRLFVAADCADARGGAAAFVVNRKQPTVVLISGDAARSWQLPTESVVNCVHVTNDKFGIRIVAVDEENVIWSIDQFGAPQEEQPNFTTIIRAPRKQPAVVPAVVEIKVNRTQQILNMLAVPSHLVPRIDDLCHAVFALLIEEKRRDEGKDVVVGADEILELDEVRAVSLNPVEMNRLKQILAA
jgi:hypothetical protein